MKELPIACTLTPAATADRVDWLGRLGRANLLSGVRRDRKLELRFRAGAVDEVRAWIKAEQECCAFLSFEVVMRDQELRLVIDAPAGAEPVLDGVLTALGAPL